MRYRLADDAKPQLTLLIAATLVTVALWFIPYAEYLVYPIRLFVTFIHESSHALVALVTGGSVQSLTIAADGSGVVYSSGASLLGTLFTSSAGYLGTTFFGVLMLFLMRKNVSPNKVLFVLGGFVGLVTLVFGVILPAFNIFSLNVGFSSIAFTVVVGALLSVGLLALSLYGSPKVANWAVAFLSIQCLLNAISDLKTVLFINSPLAGSDIQNDASNMAAATGIPGFLWVVVWIAIAAVMIVIGMRFYAIRQASPAKDSLFEDGGGI
ncbi:MAG TPA: M50 family metallopeptidase [Pyrinomonadaceae bacterium]|nr:M50 family metallopeptidase [Pyrinomonadaceae bacterium]